MSIEETIRRIQEENRRSRERSHDQTRRLINVALGFSDESLDEILEGAIDDERDGTTATDGESDDAAVVDVDPQQFTEPVSAGQPDGRDGPPS